MWSPGHRGASGETGLLKGPVFVVHQGGIFGRDGMDAPRQARPTTDEGWGHRADDESPPLGSPSDARPGHPSASCIVHLDKVAQYLAVSFPDGSTVGPFRCCRYVPVRLDAVTKLGRGRDDDAGVCWIRSETHDVVAETVPRAPLAPRSWSFLAPAGASLPAGGPSLAAVGAAPIACLIPPSRDDEGCRCRNDGRQLRNPWQVRPPTSRSGLDTRA